MLIPVSNEAPKGSKFITYTTYDQVGMAELINNQAGDLGRSDISGKETTHPVEPYGLSYGYSLQEIQQSQLTGIPLDQRRANAARRAAEERVNDIGFFGDDRVNLPGFFNNPNIPKSAALNSGTGGAREWSRKNPDQIIFDINDIFADIFETSKMKESGNTLLLPPKQWSYIVSTPRASNSDTTIANFIAASSPYLNSPADIIPVNECAAENNPGESSDIMIAYTRSPEKLEYEIPQELEWLPVQLENFKYKIPGWVQIGGVHLRYPLSAAIATGI